MPLISSSFLLNSFNAPLISSSSVPFKNVSAYPHNSLIISYFCLSLLASKPTSEIVNLPPAFSNSRLSSSIFLLNSSGLSNDTPAAVDVSFFFSGSPEALFFTCFVMSTIAVASTAIIPPPIRIPAITLS